MSNNRKISYGELFDAIEQNGFKKIDRLYYDGNEGYCSLGQASKNLGFMYNGAVGNSLKKANIQVFTFITTLNDETDLTLPEIAAKCRRRFFNSYPFLSGSFEVTDGY